MIYLKMDSRSLLQAFKELPLSEQKHFLQELRLDGVSDLLIESDLQVKPNCSHCESDKVSKAGKQSGRQRYVCKDCRKYFSSTYGTPLYKIQRRDKWNEYLKLMEQGVSIKRSAKILGISIQTSFDWRHKIMASLQEGIPEFLSGVVECDELSLLESQKGNKNLNRKPRQRSGDGKNHKAKKVSIVMATSREKGIVASVVDAKKISGKQAAEALENKLTPKTILITDENRAYNKVAKENPEIKHKTISSWKNRQEKPKNGIHLQTINNQHKQLRDFLRRFNGVATKYLPNHLNWFIYNQMNKDNLAKLKDKATLIVTATTALEYLAKIHEFQLIIRT